jgi:hypothetical protein
VEDFRHRHFIGSVDFKRYCAERVCMSLKEQSYGVRVQFGAAVCYS